MALEEQFTRTLQFIEGNWHLQQQGMPLPNAGTSDDCCAQDRGIVEFARADPEHPFGEILPGEPLHIAELKGRIKSNIPSAEQNAQLIEICANTGIDFSYSFADRHPDMPVDLVGIISAGDIGRGVFYTPSLAQRDAELGIRRYKTQVELDGPTAEVMARLFAANGLRSTRYHSRDLCEGFENITLRGKELYVVGFRCPGFTATQALEEAIDCNAQAIVLTNTAMPTLLPSERKPLSGMGKAAEREYHRAMELLHDPNASHSADPDRFKYNYADPAARMRCFALKQLRIVDMALFLQEKGYTTRVYALDDPRNHTENAAEHVLYGFKHQDILKPVLQDHASR